MPRATYPPVPDTARVDLLFATDTGVASVEWEMSFYVNNNATVRNAAYANDVSNRFEAAWHSNIEPVTNARTQLIGTRFVDLNTTIHPTVEIPIEGDVGDVGNLASSTPLTACAVVRLIGEFGTSPKKSYVRMSGLDDTQADSNYLTVAGRDALQAAWEGFVEDCTGTGDALVIVSVYNPGGEEEDRFLDEGTTNEVNAVDVRRLLGRSVSRLQ